MQGKCKSMCPEHELRQRTLERTLHQLEKLHPGWVVKAYRRNSVNDDVTEQILPEELRPEPVLRVCFFPPTALDFERKPWTTC